MAYSEGDTPALWCRLRGVAHQMLERTVEHATVSLDNRRARLDVQRDAHPRLRQCGDLVDESVADVLERQRGHHRLHDRALVHFHDLRGRARV